MIVAAGLEPEGLQLRGGEQGSDMLVASRGTAAVEIVIGEKGQIRAEFAFDLGMLSSGNRGSAAMSGGWTRVDETENDETANKGSGENRQMPPEKSFHAAHYRSRCPTDHIRLSQKRLH